MDLQINKLVLN